MTQHSSLLASLGAALHLPVRGGGSGGSLKQRPAPLDAFEQGLAARLEALKTAADAAYFSLPWLQQALACALDTHAEADALLPHLRAARGIDHKWLDDYMDDSAKLLDCCNVLREELADVDNYLRLVHLALHALGPGPQERGTEVQYLRARSTLVDCKGAVVRKDEAPPGPGLGLGLPLHGSLAHSLSCHNHKSRLESYGSILRTMGEKLAASKPHQGTVREGQEFLLAAYGAKVITIFVCALIVAAISFRPRKPPPHISVGHGHLWSQAFLTLQHKVKEETDSRRARSPVTLLQELDAVDTAVRKAFLFLDSLLTSRAPFPLTQEQVNDLGKLVEILRTSATELETGSAPLQHQINDLFKALVTSRINVLDSLTSSSLTLL